MSNPSVPHPSPAGADASRSGLPSHHPSHALPPQHHLHDSHSAPSGMLHHLWGWCEAMLRYAQLRAELALTEAKEAGSHYGMIVGLFVGALILGLLAYLFLILTIVFALAEWMDGVPHAWLKILGGATGLHLVLAVVLALIAKGRLKAGVFEKTKEEFRKDKAWPKTSTPTPKI